MAESGSRSINVLEFRGDEVAREVVYITGRVEAAPGRVHLAEHFDVP